MANIFSIDILIFKSPLPFFLKDHASNYSDELDTDDLASLLNNWEDPSSDAGARSPGRLDVPDGLPSGADSVAPPPRPPPMDIEADVSIGARTQMKLQQENTFHHFDGFSRDVKLF